MTSQPVHAVARRLSAAEFAAFFDHTVLKPDALPGAVGTLCQEAIEYGFKGVCVNPCHIPQAARLLKGTSQLPMAVVGFPLGANQTAIKAEETRRAVADGALEIDMVINIGMYLAGEKNFVRDDIAAVTKAAGKVPVKVIFETAYLTQDQIADLTGISAAAGAALVKTSTGFGPRGATTEDIRTMARHAGKMGVKASGGVRTLDDALAMIEAGATRIGSSATVKIFQDFLKLKG